MNYFINPQALSAVFTVPCSVVDKGLKLATEAQLKVLLFVLRNLSNGISAESAAEFLSIPLSEAEDALFYWQQAGVFGSDSQASAVKTEENAAAAPPVKQVLKPSRTDVARRGLEDSQVRFMLSEAQLRFGRNLKSNEASTLLWLYDDQGMDVSVILMLLQYAVSSGRLNVTVLEKTAIAWLKNGVKTVAEAEEQIAVGIRRESAWHIVETAFGIKQRRPSPKELEKSDIWLNDWKISRELLHSAYNACVDRKSEFNFAYTAKIIEDWHKRGISTPEAAERDAEEHNAKRNGKNKAKESSGASYKLDEFERMLNSDDE